MVASGDWILFSVHDGLDLISPDGKSRRKLTSRALITYSFSKRGDAVYGIFHNTTTPNSALHGDFQEWQLCRVDVATGAEKLVSAVDLPPSAANVASFSIHPGGKRALASVAKFPYQIWMLEGFDQPPAKNWLACIMGYR